MAAGFVDLDVRYTDSISFRGVAVDNLRGEVKTAAGFSAGTVIPDGFQDANGAFYGVLDYDVRDASQFFGTFIKVYWSCTYHGIALPIIEKRYDFLPVAPEPVNKTLIYWLPLNDPLYTYYYDVYRYRDSTEEFVGRTFATSFSDTKAFASEFEARSWKYKIYTNKSNPGYAPDPDEGDFIRDGSALAPYYVGRAGVSLCEISGKVTDLSGRPEQMVSEYLEQAPIEFTVNWRDRFEILGDTIILPEGVYVSTGQGGAFSVGLLQDAVVEMRIPMINFTARFIVPRQDKAKLSELNIELLRE